MQSLGGADYRYALKGDGQTPFTIIEGAEQRDALETVLSTLDVDFLALSDDIISLIPPPAFRHSAGEIFEGYTEQIFDPLAAAEASAAFTVGEILHPQGMARLVLYGSMGDYPDLEEVVDRLIEVTWGAGAQNDEYHQRILHAVQRTVIDQMMQQATITGIGPMRRPIRPPSTSIEPPAAALEAGNDIRTALLCFALDASHGYERTHLDSVMSLARLLTLYMQSKPMFLRDKDALGPLGDLPATERDKHPKAAE